jgi:hypothetical protein
MMHYPRVVNLNTHPYDVYIGRGSIWGNPYSHLKGTKALHIVKTRKQAVMAYKQYLLQNEELLEKLPTLVGKVLGCYCAPKLCHGHMIIDVMQMKGII